MSIQTRTITATIFDNDGDPLPNAKVQITLRGLGNEPGGAVSPGTQTQLTNSSGVATFELWQNNGSYSDTYYEISSWNPVTGVSIHRKERFLVPAYNADVKELLALGLAGVDPTLDLLQQVQSALTQTQAAANSAASSSSTASSAANTATTQAATATNQAGIATGAANTATTKASEAQGYASTASSAASAAASSADAATGSANTATTQAGIATAQANIAATKASEASGHKDAAEAAATTATGAANTATTQAGTATSAAGTATTQAGIATVKADESNTSKLAAEVAAVLAQRWASEAEDTPVTGGLYSAFHWAKKAEALVEVVTDGAVMLVNGYGGPSVDLTYTDVGAASAAQGALADSAVQPSDLSTALNDFYTKTAADARYLQIGAIEASTYIKRIRTLALAGL